VALNDKYEEGTCCVCGHSLDTHFDEGTGWRCHSLDRSFHQCECWLRKHEYAETIDYYDLNKRRRENKELTEFLIMLKEEEP